LVAHLSRPPARRTTLASNSRSAPRESGFALRRTIRVWASSTTNSTLKPPKPFVTRAMAALLCWRIN
jgi:hypothetical protein